VSDRKRTIEWSDPQATAGAAAGKTGRAFLENIVAGVTPPAPIQHTLGFRLDAVGDGKAQFVGTFGEHMYNPMAGVHGGILATLLDSAMGCAVMSLLDEKTGYTTADLVVHFTRPVTAGTGEFVAKGEVIHRGKRLMTAGGQLLDSNGKLLAHATCTCMLLDR
jgi:uncharacterized protein (TIGR00369 family)